VTRAEQRRWLDRLERVLWQCSADATNGFALDPNWDPESAVTDSLDELGRLLDEMRDEP
jgi:hypothetical protein